MANHPSFSVIFQVYGDGVSLTIGFDVTKALVAAGQTGIPIQNFDPSAMTPSQFIPDNTTMTAAVVGSVVTITLAQPITGPQEISGTLVF